MNQNKIQPSKIIDESIDNSKRNHIGSLTNKSKIPINNQIYLTNLSQLKSKTDAERYISMLTNMIPISSQLTDSDRGKWLFTFDSNISRIYK